MVGQSPAHKKRRPTQFVKCTCSDFLSCRSVTDSGAMCAGRLSRKSAMCRAMTPWTESGAFGESVSCGGFAAAGAGAEGAALAAELQPESFFSLLCVRTLAAVLARWLFSCFSNSSLRRSSSFCCRKEAP